MPRDISHLIRASYRHLLPPVFLPRFSVSLSVAPSGPAAVMLNLCQLSLFSVNDLAVGVFVQRAESGDMNRRPGDAVLKQAMGVVCASVLSGDR